MPPLLPLTGDEGFLYCLQEFHDLEVSPADLRELHRSQAAIRQRSQLSAYRLAHSEEITSITVWDVDNGKNAGKLIGSAIAIGTAIASGNWWAAGLALVSGVISLLEKPPPVNQEEQFIDKGGFEQGGQLAPAGGVLPRIYCNRAINPAGGVRVGGLLVHSRVDTRRGSTYLYQLYIVSAGESETLGYGKMGSIDDQATLFNRQPRRNFSDDEIQTYTRLGTRAQSAIDQFPYYCQVVSPPDYKVFGIDSRSKIKTVSTAANQNAATVNATVNGNSIAKTAGGNAWNAGYFGPTGITGDGEFVMAPAIGKAGVGLSKINQDNDWTSIQYGFYFDAAGAWVVESGALRASPTTASVLKIRISNGSISYLAEDTVLYTSAIAPAFPLFPDIALFDSNASVPYFAIAGASGGGATTISSSTIVPTPNQEQKGQRQTVLDLFPTSSDYVVAISGEVSRDPQFRILNKDLPSQSFTTVPALATGGFGNTIYSYWYARYETTKRVDRIDINMQFSLSARADSGKTPPEEDDGKLTTHASLFDLWLRPANGATGSEVFVIRLLAKNRGTQRIHRAFRITNLALGRYYFELRPLTFCPYDIAKPIYELTDSGYDSDDYLDLETLPIVDPGVTMAGSAIKIQGELEQVTDGKADADVNGGYFGNPSIQVEGDRLICLNAPQSAQNPSPVISGSPVTVEVSPSTLPINSFIFYGLADAAGAIQHGWRVQRGAPDTLTITKIVNAQLQTPVIYTYFPVKLTYGMDAGNAIVSLNGAQTVTPVTPIVPYFARVTIFSSGNPVTTGSFPAPKDPSEIPPVQNVYSLGLINDWLSYEHKTQVSSESAPTGTITAINEIVHPKSIGKTGPERYPGIALQGYRFKYSERLTGPPGTRTLVDLGTECPNWLAAGSALRGSSGNYLVVNDSNFVTAGLKVGHQIRNLERHITGTITEVTPTTIKTDRDMGWVGGGYCGDRYAAYFIGSTCYFPDVYCDLIRNDFGGIPEIIDPDEFIDYVSIVKSRAFCVANKYYFDDIIESKVAFAEFVTRNCRLSYLYPVKVGGRYGLTPEKPEGITGVFNSSNSRNFERTWPDFQNNLTNTIVLRYVDGRDEFTQTGARHRTVTITIQTTAAADGLEPAIYEDVDAKSVKSIEQAIAVGCLYLKSLRRNTAALTFETSYYAAYTEAGDIIAAQSPALGIGCDYSGAVAEVRSAGGDWLVRLDCQPSIKTGYQPEDVAAGVAGINNDGNSIAPGFLLRNQDTGESAAISGATATEILAPLKIKKGDEYEVLSAIMPSHDLSITYRETGNTDTLSTATTEFIDGVAWLRLKGATEEPRLLDPVIVHNRTELFRVLSIAPSGRDVFQISAIAHSDDIYDRKGLVISWDETVLRD